MEKYRMSVFGTVQFEAIHCWPDAQAPVEFLRNPHRHLFKLEFRAGVEHDDRDIEFITLKQQVETFCRQQWDGRDIGTTSCEQIAVAILDNFPEIGGVTVSEDGENGANVCRRKAP